MRGAVISLEFESHQGQTWDLSSEIPEEWVLKLTLYGTYRSSSPMPVCCTHTAWTPCDSSTLIHWENLRLVLYMRGGRGGKTPVLCNQPLVIHVWILKQLGEIHGCRAGKRTQLSLTEAIFPLHRYRNKRNWLNHRMTRNLWEKATERRFSRTVLKIFLSI